MNKTQTNNLLTKLKPRKKLGSLQNHLEIWFQIWTTFWVKKGLLFWCKIDYVHRNLFWHNWASTISLGKLFITIKVGNIFFLKFSVVMSYIAIALCLTYQYTVNLWYMCSFDHVFIIAILVSTKVLHLYQYWLI